MNSVGIEYFRKFFIYFGGAKSPLRNELLSKGRGEMQIFELDFCTIIYLRLEIQAAISLDSRA